MCIYVVPHKYTMVAIVHSLQVQIQDHLAWQVFVKLVSSRPVPPWRSDRTSFEGSAMNRTSRKRCGKRTTTSEPPTTEPHR